MMAYFKAIGTFIDNCRLCSILEMSEMITHSSINSFAQGKRFNHCKKLHPIAILALQILHFESFIFIEERTDSTTDDMISYIEELKKKDLF